APLYCIMEMAVANRGNDACICVAAGRCNPAGASDSIQVGSSILNGLNEVIRVTPTLAEKDALLGRLARLQGAWVGEVRRPDGGAEGLGLPPRGAVRRPPAPPTAGVVAAGLKPRGHWLKAPSAPGRVVFQVQVVDLEPMLRSRVVQPLIGPAQAHAQDQAHAG